MPKWGFECISEDNQFFPQMMNSQKWYAENLPGVKYFPGLRTS
jgi:hypothetical protein